MSTRVWKKCGIPNPGKCQTVLRNVSLHCVASGHLTCLYIQSYINCVKHMIILSWNLNMHKCVYNLVTSVQLYGHVMFMH